MKITKRQLNKIIREELRTKPSKHDPQRIIKEATSRVLNESTLQSAEERADSVLSELMDAYLAQYLNPDGLNRDDALNQAYADLRNFVEGVIETTNDFEAHPEDQHSDGTKLADMSSSWQQVLGSTPGYPK